MFASYLSLFLRSGILRSHSLFQWLNPSPVYALLRSQVIFVFESNSLCCLRGSKRAHPSSSARVIGMLLKCHFPILIKNGVFNCTDICVQKFLYQPSFSMQNRVPTQKVYAQAKLAQSTHKPGKRNTMISKNAMLRDRNHTLCSLHKNHDSILQ